MDGGVLVTGAAGYVGGRLVRQLAAAGAACDGVDVAPAPGHRHHVLDLRDRAGLTGLLERARPRCVVHAGTHSALAYRARPRDCFRGDFEAADSLLDSLAAAGCQASRLVTFSSSYVASGLPPDRAIDEESPVRPSHAFGAAKLFFEDLFRRAHPESVVFRLCSVFGPGAARFPNAIDAMAAEAATTGKVTVWGQGRRRTQYVFLDDVIRCVVAACDGAIPPGLYHLGGDEHVPIAEAAAAIAKRRAAEVTFDRERQEGETLPLLDNRKIKRALGDRAPFRGLERALDDWLAGGTSA